MNNQQSTGNAIGQSLQRIGLGSQRQVRRELEQIQSQTIMAKMTEEGRAYLAQTALENVGALSAMEDHLMQVAPNGAARYREIVDSYAIGASSVIRKWGQ